MASFDPNVANGLTDTITKLMYAVLDFVTN